MIEQEFAAIQERPEQVLEGLGLVFVLLEGRGERRNLLRSRLAREAADVELGDPLREGLLAGLDPGDQAALLDLLVDRLAIEQVERLRERRLHLDLARAHRLSGGPAESSEE